MKSSTLSSLSVVVETFLKYSPAFFPGIGAVICACADGRAADTKPHSHAAARPATASRHHNFMCVPPYVCVLAVRDGPECPNFRVPYHNAANYCRRGTFCRRTHGFLTRASVDRAPPKRRK